MTERLSLIASTHPLAQSVSKKWREMYTFSNPEDADIIIVLGGDGMILKTLREHPSKKIYGMHVGNVGFLMNTFHGEIFEDTLMRIHHASEITLHPLAFKAHTTLGKEFEGYAINEVALFRATAQAAKIAISVDGKERLEELSCDGIMLSTPAGSTAYNLSAHGPIIPLGTNLLALTPISPFRPRRWRGALLPSNAHIEFNVLNADHRLVLCSFDDKDLRDDTSTQHYVSQIKIHQDLSKSYTLLFDPDHDLEDRIISEQFLG